MEIVFSWGDQVPYTKGTQTGQHKSYHVEGLVLAAAPQLRVTGSGHVAEWLESWVCLDSGSEALKELQVWASRFN